MKSSTYYFHMKTKILADFQICISVPLRGCYNIQKKCRMDDRYSWIKLQASHSHKSSEMWIHKMN